MTDGNLIDDDAADCIWGYADKLPGNNGTRQAAANLHLTEGPTFNALRSIRPRSVLELLTEDIPEPPPLIKGILPAQCFGLIYGLEKVGKSFLALQLACAIATGTDFLGFGIHEKRRVLFISPEGNDANLKKRIADFILHLSDAGVDVRVFKENLYTVSTLGSLKVDTKDGERFIRQWIEDTGAEVVVLDSIYRLVSKGSENSHEDARPLHDFLDRLKGAGLSIIGVHHARKQGDADKGTAEVRGAGWSQFSDAILRLSKDNSGKYSLGFTLRHYIGPEPLELIRNGPLFTLAGQSDWSVSPSDVLDVLEANGGRVEGKAAFSSLIRKEYPEASRRDIDRAILEAEQQQMIRSCKSEGRAGVGRTYFIPAAENANG